MYLRLQFVLGAITSLLLSTACDGSNDSANQGGGELGHGASGGSSGAAGSGGSGGADDSGLKDQRCETPLHPFQGDHVDEEAATTLTACLTENGVNRIDVEGKPLCQDLSRPCVDGWNQACTHECEADADCPPGNVCICAAGLIEPQGDRLALTSPGAGANRCLPADCTASSDCDGWACGLSGSACGPITDGLYCRSAKDECASDLDCTGSQVCRYSTDLWKCVQLATCG